MEQIALLFSLAGLVAFVKKLNDVAARVLNGAYRSALSQVVVYVLSFVGVAIFAKSGIAGGQEIMPGQLLKNLSIIDQVIVAVQFGSIASVIYDNQQARDSSVETVTYPLIPDGTIDNL